MIGIIGAMDEEVEKVRADMEQTETVEASSLIFYKGKLYGKDAVVVTGGIGKVNAAICAQILADRFDVDVLLNTGVAGSLDAGIDIGDLVISEDVLQYDIDASALGDPVGQVPRMDTFAFPADAGLVRKAVSAGERANPDIHTFTGRIASGDRVVADDREKAWIVEKFQAVCTEMEGAGVAQAAYVNGIPFVIIRAVSDKADGSASVEYPVFKRAAIGHGYRLLRELIPEI